MGSQHWPSYAGQPLPVQGKQSGMLAEELLRREEMPREAREQPEMLFPAAVPNSSSTGSPCTPGSP